MYRGSRQPATDFEGGPVSVGTSAIEITFVGKTRAIHVQADHDNADEIYCGKSNVQSDGSNAVMRLDGGEGTGWDLEDGQNPLWVVAGGAGNTVYKMALLK